MKPLKSIESEHLEEGDEVFIGHMDRVKVDYCQECNPPSDEWISENMGKLIFDTPCEKHN